MSLIIDDEFACISRFVPIKWHNPHRDDQWGAQPEHLGQPTSACGLGVEKSAIHGDYLDYG